MLCILSGWKFNCLFYRFQASLVQVRNCKCKFLNFGLSASFCIFKQIRHFTGGRLLASSLEPPLQPRLGISSTTWKIVQANTCRSVLIKQANEDLRKCVRLDNLQGKEYFDYSPRDEHEAGFLLPLIHECFYRYFVFICLTSLLNLLMIVLPSTGREGT